MRFIREAGLTHFAYRTDREAALGAVVDEACSILGRTCKRIANDADHRALELPLPEIEYDEPDAPTSTPAVPESGGPNIAVPELTHPGESASNGLAERSVGIVANYVRTLLLAPLSP